MNITCAVMVSAGSIIRRIHFDIHGEPVFNMDEAHDLSPALREVHTTVCVADEEA